LIGRHKIRVAKGRLLHEPIFWRREFKKWLISPIVLGEFRFGILGSRHRASYEQRLRLIEWEFPPLPINGATAGYYAALRRELAMTVHPIPWHDLRIAAQARQHQLAILSRDEHFDAMLNL
jgi:tRNA(fMet)-specific endonuclease VapC